MTEQKNNSEENTVEIHKSEWLSALEDSAKNVHIIGAWIAIIFVPIFGITDFLNIPEHFLEILIIRISVSILTLFTLFLYRKNKFPSFWLVLVPFTLISFQNAYTFMLIDEAGVLGHCLNYIALFLGAGMFILWPMIYSFGVVAFSLITTFIFFNFNDQVTGNYFWIHGGLLKLNIEIFMIILIQFRYRLTIKEIKARLALEKSKNLLAKQKNVIEEKNNLLMDSLQYAKRIQDAILGDQKTISNWFKDAFILFKPKDVVSGDFYMLHYNEKLNIKIVIAADCTGHGVPAALMTVLGNSLLSDIIEHRGIFKPNEILSALDDALIKSLKKTNANNIEVNDGMDMSILVFTDDSVLFSAAKNPLLIIRNEEMQIVKGSKSAIGGSAFGAENKSFELHEFKINKGDKYYIFSDGYQDQFGGPKDKKYMTKRYREFLIRISREDMESQKTKLDNEFEEWKGNLDQTDDLLVIGIAAE